MTACIGPSEHKTSCFLLLFARFVVSLQSEKEKVSPWNTTEYIQQKRPTRHTST